MKRLLWLAIAIISFVPAIGQVRGFEFSGNTAKFPQELDAYFTSERREEPLAIISQFKTMWEAGKFDRTSQEEIIELANEISKARLRPVPDFVAYLSALNAAAASGRLEQYLEIGPQMLKADKSGFTNTNIALALIMSQNKLNESSQKHWQFSGNEYDLKFGKITVPDTAGKTKQITTAYVEFKNIDLTLHTLGETISINRTSGRYVPSTFKWSGRGGDVYWVRAGLPEQEASARLRNYALDTRSSDYTADSVELTFPKAFQRPILGRLHDKAMIGASGSQTTYPRFSSYQAQFEIKNIFPNVDYQGGFTLEGAQIMGTGTPSGGRASITVRYNGKPALKAYSNSFSIEPEKIASLKSAITIYIDKDSIHHTQLVFNFNANERRVMLSRERTGLSEAPYFDSYHRLEFKVDNMLWKIDEGEMKFQSIANPRRPMEFFSSDFFKVEDYQMIQGALDYNPLARMKSFLDGRDSRSFTVEELATYFRNKPEYIQNLLFLLAIKGFIFYDVDAEVVVVKEKLLHYVAAYRKQVDFDNINFASQVGTRDTANAVFDLNTNQLNLAGVKQIWISDSQQTYILPLNGAVAVKKNRDMNFDGQVHSGRFDYWGDEFFFDYDKFQFNLTNCDSVKFKFPEYDTKGNPIRLRQIANAIENVSGFLYVDKPDNKSGLQMLDSFPIFKCTKESYVYYDRKSIFDHVYDKERFFFTLKPFKIVNLDKFTADNLEFPGTFTSADIIPVIPEALKIQPDFSLGFVHTSPGTGYKMYKGKGTGTGTFLLSNQGFRAEARVGYLGSFTASKEHYLFPDSMNAVASNFEIKENANSKYPPAEGIDVRAHWMPYADSLYIMQKKNPIKVYNGKIDFAGDLILTPSELVGQGVMKYQNLSIASQSFAFFAKNAQSKSGELSIKAEVGSQDVLTAADVNANIDFTKDFGTFQTNADTTEVLLPSNKYATSLNNFTYDFRSKEVKFARDKDQHAEDAYFVSKDPNKKNLSFISEKASYKLSDQNVIAEGVPFIEVADVRIYTPDQSVNIQKDGNLGSFNGAKVVTPIYEETYVIYDALVNVIASDRYAGYGTYDYIDVKKQKWPLYFADLRTENGNTIARGVIGDTANFYLSPRLRYTGKVVLRSQAERLHFDGAVLAEHDYESLATKPVKMNDSIDPQYVTVAVANAVGADGKPVFTGVYHNRPSGTTYTLFLGNKMSPDDHSVMEASGTLLYDEKLNAFRVGKKRILEMSDEELADPFYVAEPYNLAELRLGRSEFSVIGKMDFGMKLKSMDLYSAGTYTINPGRTEPGTFRAMIMVDLPFNDDALKMMVNGLIDYGSDDEPADYSAKHLEPAVLQLVDNKKDRDKVLQDMQSYGYILSVDQTNRFMVFPTVTLQYNDSAKAYVSVGKLELGNLMKEHIDKKLEGKMTLRPGDSKDEGMFFVIVMPEKEEYYYFRYMRGMVTYHSSDIDLLEKIGATASKTAKARKGLKFVKAETEEALDYKYDLIK